MNKEWGKTEEGRTYYREYKRAWLDDPGNRAKTIEQRQARYWQLKRFLAAVKTTAGCIDCGYDSHACALEFDHVGVKSREVSNANSIRQAVVEIMECEVRCANCHRVITQERRDAARVV
jgi:hypothetical protein